MKKIVKITALVLAGAVPIILYYYYKIAIATVDIGSYHEGFFFGVIVILFLITLKKYKDNLKE